MRAFLVSMVSLVLLGTAGTGVADSTFVPEVLNQVPDRIFIPPGFDNNDHAQVVIEGEYLSTCYKSGPAQVTVDHEKKMISVQNQTYFYNGAVCIFVEVPYTKTVDLGVLGDGTYGIQFEDSKGQWHAMSQISVATSETREPDNYLYAPVEEVELKKSEAGDFQLFLSGYFTNTCMSLQDVQILQRTSDVIEVLPIMNMDESGCEKDSRPFRSIVKLQNPPKGRALVHVRVLNGQALNRVIDFRK